MTSADSPQLDVDGNPVPTGPGAHLDSNGNVIPVVAQNANAQDTTAGFVDTQGEWLQVQARFMELSGMPNTRYLGYSHQELKAMVDQRNDPGQVGELGSAWHDLGARFVEFDTELWRTLLTSQQHWTGAAADRARGSGADIGTWFADAGRHAQLAGNRLAGQAEVAAWARDAMPEPVESDRLSALRAAGQQTDPLAFPADLGAIETQEQAKREAHHQAAMIVEQYDRQLAEYGATMPAFGPPPTAPDAGDGSSTGWPDGHGDTGPGPDGSGVDGPQGPPPAPGSPAAPVQPSIPVGPIVDPDLGDVRDKEGLTTGQQTTSGAPSSSTGVGGPAPGSSGAGHGGGSHGGASLMPVGPPSAGPRAGSLGSTAGPVGGVRPGGRSAGGLTGLPLGSRRQTEEDEEHDTAEYLVEPDPESLFGVVEKTVRPVIGEA